MARSKTGEAISAKRRTRASRAKLQRFIERAEKRGDLPEWRRGRAVLGYIDGKRVVDLVTELDVSRGSVNRWLGRYERLGIPGIETGKPPGAQPKLSAEDRGRLIAVVEAGPLAAGYTSGVWTGPMIGDLIEAFFGVRYHNHTVPRLLHELGFSVQRPRKRLSRADAEAQDVWRRKRFPAIKKKPALSGES